MGCYFWFCKGFSSQVACGWWREKDFDRRGFIACLDKAILRSKYIKVELFLKKNLLRKGRKVI